MKTRTTRVIALSLCMLSIFGALVYRLIQLQLIQGGQTAESLNANIIRNYDELASRGEILDRDGRVMVDNALSFSVQLDYYEWDKKQQNQVILQLWETLQQNGIACSDILPLSREAPLAYTWTSLDSGNGKKLQKFADAREWGRVEDLTPNRLFGLLCSRYGVDPDLTLEQRRAVIGVRYYLEDYQFSAYNTPVTLAEEVDIRTVARVSEQSGELPGMTIQVTGSREYSTGAAAHVLGRVAAISREEYEAHKDEGYALTDTIGKDGMEQALEQYLRGTDGLRAVEVDSRTGQVAAEYMVEETQPGKNCYLTLDLPLQERVEQSLADTLAAIKEKGEASKDGAGADVAGGAAVVIDVNTGEILAMASWPTYSLATFSADYSMNQANELHPF